MLAGAMACMLCLSGAGAQAASGQHEVTASKLNFRQEASADGEVIARLTEGTVVTVLSTSGSWAKVRWDGQEGYLSVEYLEKISGASVSGSNTTKLSGTGWMEKDGWLYKAADTESEQMKELKKGAEMSIRGETVNFYYVKVDGEYGYVLKKRVSMKAPKQAESGRAAAAANEGERKVLRMGDEGSDVKALQKALSKLGYLKEKYITGYYGNLTEQAVRNFQLRANLTADGVAGPATRGKLESSSAPRAAKVVEMDWFDSDVSAMVKKRGGTAKIIDCETGVVINIRRVGGSNHMDVEPLKASDTAKLKELYGGTWSWERRAVVLVVDGKYIAASINGMPHGAEISTSNGFDGQFCLHTTNSRTHGTDRVDGDHQRCIEEALDFS